MKLTLIASLLLGSSITLAVQAASVDVKPGLWEFTTSMDPNEFSALQKQQGSKMQESMTQALKAMEEAKAKMTPEQRKLMEQMMASNPPADAAKTAPKTAPAMSASAQDTMKQLGHYMETGTMVNKSCITQKEIDDATFMKEEKHGDCVTKSTQVSSSLFKSTTDCKGTDHSHMEAEVTLVNPKNFTAKFVSNSIYDNKPLVMHGQQNAKWIASDCGEYSKPDMGMEEEGNSAQ